MDWIDAAPQMVADLEQALDHVWDKMHPNAQEEFRSLPREDLHQCHFGLGRAIRNDLLYGRNFKTEGRSAVHTYFADQLGLTEGDDISAIIIEALWCKVNGQEFDLADRIKFYQDYWATRGVFKP